MSAMVMSTMIIDYDDNDDDDFIDYVLTMLMMVTCRMLFTLTVLA